MLTSLPVFLISSFAGLILYLIAQPLADPTQLWGLGNRYAVGGEAARARMWLAHAGEWLVLWAALGAIQVELARRMRPSLVALLTLSGIAALSAAPTQAFHISTETWLFTAIACLGLVSALLALKYKWQLPSLAARTDTPIPLAWPGFLLLSGLGTLLNADLAARGPPALSFKGLDQFDALWLASFFILPLSCLWRERLLLGLAASATWLERRNLKLQIGMVIIFALSAGWLIRAEQTANMHRASELLRLILALILAWLLYRHGERWGGARKRRWVGWIALPLVLLTFVASLFLGGDWGPILVVAWGSLLLLAGLIPGRVAAMLMLTMCLSAFYWTLTQWLPGQHWVSPLILERIEALLTPFTAHRPYLSQHAWLLEAVPAEGGGLTGVPWCGAQAALGIVRCTDVTGIARQMPSDYTWIALAAAWGKSGAISLLILLLAYVLALSRTTWPDRKAEVRNLDLERLRVWIVIVYGVLMVAQAMTTVAGNLGWIPLTGITLPFLSLGSTSLQVAALWVGLGTARVTPNRRSAT